MRSSSEIDVEIKVQREAVSIAEKQGLPEVAAMAIAVLHCLLWVAGEEVEGYGDNMPKAQAGVH